MKKVIAILAVLMLVAGAVFAAATIKIQSKVGSTVDPAFILRASLTGEDSYTTASAGEGLLVYKAIQYKNEGHTLEETASYIEDLKNHLGHVFTVDDLNCLHRGGRVSKTVAIIGTLANIKPILHVDNEGHLTPLGNVRGRKKSILSLIDAMEKQMGSYRDKNDCIFISNGDCMDDANFAADTIRERFGIEDIRISDVGPVIGSHSGPGTLAIFFLADYK